MARKDEEDPTLAAQAQAFLHGSTFTLVMPGLLFLISTVLLFYRGLTQEHTDLPLNGFLANIVVQMMPLVALKAKIYSCTDRLSLVPLVLCKTLLMHVVLGGFRVSSQVVQDNSLQKHLFAVDTAGMLGALALLKYEFDFSLNPMQWMKHTDVRNLVGLAACWAVITEVGFNFVPDSWMSEATRNYFRNPMEPDKILFTAANYVDIVAFMPIVWKLYQADQEHEDNAVGTTVSTGARRQVKFFFAYLSLFYLWDDVVDPLMGGLTEEPLAIMAHMAHYMLLLDFAGFFIFQVAQPSNVKEAGMERGEQLQGLLSQDDDDY